MDKIFIIQLITSLIGTLGFAVLFKVRPRYLAITALVGAFGYAVYYLAETVWSLGSFAAALCASVFIAAVSEILARGIRTPATVFMLPGLIPIVPGGALYHTMRSFITKSGEKALSYGWEVIKISVGIAGGIVVVSVIVHIILGISERFKNIKGDKQ